MRKATTTPFYAITAFVSYYPTLIYFCGETLMRVTIPSLISHYPHDSNIEHFPIMVSHDWDEANLSSSSYVL